MNLIANAAVPRSALTLPPPRTLHDAILDWLQHVDVQIPDAKPIALRWQGNDCIEIDPAVATDDDLIIEPCTPTIEDLAHALTSIARDHHTTYPGPLSWRRWPITSRIAMALYTSGITSSGGCTRWDGMDPWGTPIHELPWFSLRGHRSYLLWKRDWWWECHRRQGLRIIGRHRPMEPYVFGVCAACMPCVHCGAQYECPPTCESWA